MNAQQLMAGGYGSLITTASWQPGEQPAVADAATLANASWLTATPAGDVVYAVSETQDGHVAAFARDAAGGLRALGERSSGGALPAHLALDPSGRFLVVVNYDGGSVRVFALRPDGSLAGVAAHAVHAGSGPRPDRQEGPHPHQTVFDPLTGVMLVADLGLDRVLGYDLDERGELHPRGDAAQAEPGTGPRHLAFAPDGSRFYLVGELDSSVTVFERAGGGFEQRQKVSTLPPGVGTPNLPAGIQVSSDGATVYVSNRGHDSIAVFRVAVDGALERSGTVPALGRSPRDILLTEDGHLIASDQDSDLLGIFAVAGDGWLEPLGTIPAVAPTCALLLPVAQQV